MDSGKNIASISLCEYAKTELIKYFANAQVAPPRIVLRNETWETLDCEQNENLGHLEVEGFVLHVSQHDRNGAPIKNGFGWGVERENEQLWFSHEEPYEPDWTQVLPVSVEKKTLRGSTERPTRLHECCRAIVAGVVAQRLENFEICERESFVCN